MSKNLCIALAFVLLFTAGAFSQTTINVGEEDSAGFINRHIFGQFSEHLGRGIYPGIWVG